jgi:energy-coupling factor transporter ATP-binding protein EcfA2
VNKALTGAPLLDPVLLQALRLSNFRSHTDSNITFKPGLNVFVGENGAGKSSIGIATEMLAAHTDQGDRPILSAADWHGGPPNEAVIEASFTLSEAESQRLVLDWLSRLPAEEGKAWRQDLPASIGVKYPLVVRAKGSGRPSARIDRLLFSSDYMQLDRVAGGQHVAPRKVWDDFVTRRTPSSPEVAPLGFHAGDYLRQQVADSVVRIQEFRSRTEQEPRTTLVASATGREVASVLLNLKNHHDKKLRAKYQEIQQEFTRFFPQYQLEAVDPSPGATQAMLQFTETRSGHDVAGTHVSSGMHQIVVLLGALVGMQGRIIFVEHPETHLHPHAARHMARLVSKAGKSNQIIVTTHHLDFVPTDWISVQRVVKRNGASRVLPFPAEATNDSRIDGQLKTVMRNKVNAEMLFARGLLLVEDITQREFVTGIMPKVADLDALSVSVLDAGGQSGFQPLMAAAKIFQIPFVALRDLDWGTGVSDSETEKYRALGMEIEEYLDQAGLAEDRARLRREMGTSKARIGRALGEIAQPSQVPRITDALRAVERIVM